MLLRRERCREGAQRTLLAFRTLVCMIAVCWVCKDAAAGVRSLQERSEPKSSVMMKSATGQEQVPGTKDRTKPVHSSNSCKFMLQTPKKRSSLPMLKPTCP
jgi:hypothetical protein